jgi:hypothetical protein
LEADKVATKLFEYKVKDITDYNQSSKEEIKQGDDILPLFDTKKLQTPSAVQINDKIDTSIP